MFKSLKELLSAAAATDAESRDARRGAALPEVSEVDWSEWESSIFHSELDALLSGPAPLPAPGGSSMQRERARPAPLPEVREVDWSVWEDSVRGQLEPAPSRPKRLR